jgi:hypothetical protein
MSATKKNMPLEYKGVAKALEASGVAQPLISRLLAPDHLNKIT